eukprot:TRINITY_DN6046_c1_g1_i2.p1 TRINITY_DN6046_c1_g1~~TRINITY_DN6046_c1_g1_i2.p1  ORF type:complete len:2070 (+),score=374.98 TRINITY_DN6046_c1_g1_i2:1898-8107(+)
MQKRKKKEKLHRTFVPCTGAQVARAQKQRTLRAAVLPHTPLRLQAGGQRPEGRRRRREAVSTVEPTAVLLRPLLWAQRDPPRARTPPKHPTQAADARFAMFASVLPLLLLSVLSQLPSAVPPLRSGSWTRVLASTGHRLRDHAVGWFGDSLVVFGGADEHGNMSAALSVCNLTTGRWATTDAVGPAARTGSSLKAHSRSGLMYLFGGEGSGGELLADLWQLDPERLQWTMLPSGGPNGPVPLPSRGFAVTNDLIIIAGPTTYRYSIAQGEWLAPVGGPDPEVPEVLAVSHEHKVYLTGAAKNGGVTMFEMDTAEGSPAWRPVGYQGGPPSSETLHGGTLPSGDLVVVDAVGTARVFTLGNSSWNEVRATCKGSALGREGVGCAVVGSTVFAVGGASPDGVQGDVVALSLEGWGPEPLCSARQPDWTHVASGDVNIYDHSSATMGSQIYVFGGVVRGVKGTDDLRIYDTARGVQSVLRQQVGELWPPPRYKCKMVVRGDKLYLFGGKTKVPESHTFRDFWEFDLTTQRWATLPSKGDNAPLGESLDGSFAVLGDYLAIVGADDAVYGTTFLYSVEQQTWMPPIHDTRTALNKPLLVTKGTVGVLIGGYSAAGTFSSGLLYIDLAAGAHWQQIAETGDAPRNDALQGGFTEGGDAIVVYSSFGSLHVLDARPMGTTDTLHWISHKSGCGWVGEREDFTANIVNGDLVMIGGVNKSGYEFADALVLQFGLRSCEVDAGTAISESKERMTEIGQPGRSLRMQFGFHGSSALSSDWRGTGVCTADRRLFVVASDEAKYVTVLPESLPVFTAGRVTLGGVADRHLTSVTCSSSSPTAFTLHLLTDQDEPLAVITEYRRDGEAFEVVARTVTDLATQRTTEAKDWSWGLTTMMVDGSVFLLMLQHQPSVSGRGLVRVLERDGSGWRVVAQALTPGVLEDYSGISVDESGLVLIVSQASSAVMIAKLVSDTWSFAAEHRVFSFPREDGRVVHCNIQGIEWMQRTDQLNFVTVSGSRTGLKQGPACVATEQSIFLWQLPLEWETFDSTPSPAMNSSTNQQGRLADRVSPWTWVADYPMFARYQHASASLGNTSVYVFGGRVQGGRPTAQLVHFDREALTAAEVPEQGLWPTARAESKLLAHDEQGVLYLLGGVTDSYGGINVPLYDLWRYNPRLSLWQELPSYAIGSRYGFGVAQGNGFSAAIVRNYIVVVGSERGSIATWLVFDLERMEWLPPYSSNTMTLERPSLAAVGSVVVLQGGANHVMGTLTPRHTYALNVTKPPAEWEWEEVHPASGTAPLGSGHLHLLSNGILALLGDPADEGDLSTSCGIALLDSDLKHEWVRVPVVDWIQCRTGFSVSALDGMVGIFGGVMGRGSQGSALAGDVWIYDPTVCPSRCNGRGTCRMGTCVDCQGSHGVACEHTNPEDLNLGLVLGLTVGGAMALTLVVLGPAAWRMRQQRKNIDMLCDDNRIAEESAEKIATMRLEELDWLFTLPNPNRIQAAFMNIVVNLKSYRPYLPASVLVAAQEECRLFEYETVKPPRGRVAICFTDIVGSTKLWEASPDDMEVVLDMHNTCVRSLIHKHKGYEVKTIGDAFMCAFADETDAVLFALDVHDGLLNQVWPDVPPFEGASVYWTRQRVTVDDTPLWGGIAVRIGIACGDVQVETNPITERADYRGRFVNLAARCESMAPPGATLVCSELVDTMASNVRDHIDFIPAGHKEMRGIGDMDTFVLIRNSLRRRVHQDGGGRNPMVDDGALECSNPLTRVRRKRSGLGSIGRETGRTERSSDSSDATHHGMRLATHMHSQKGSIAVARLVDTGCDDREHLNEHVSRCAMEAVKTAGKLEGIFGSAAQVTWNLVVPCDDHRRQFLLFMVRVAGNLRDACVGGASGAVFHGLVGTVKQKFRSISGKVHSTAEELSRRAGVAQSRCLVAFLDRAPTQLLPALRPVDVWSYPADAIVVSIEEPLSHDAIMGAIAHLNISWDEDPASPSMTAQEVPWRALFDRVVHQADASALDALEGLAPGHFALPYLREHVSKGIGAAFLTRAPLSLSKVDGAACPHVRTHSLDSIEHTPLMTHR